MRSRASTCRWSRRARGTLPRLAWSRPSSSSSFELTLLDGAFHERDSSTWAVELAAAVAFREAAARASAQVLEPMMAVEVVSSADHLGDVNGDL